MQILNIMPTKYNHKVKLLDPIIYDQGIVKKVHSIRGVHLSIKTKKSSTIRTKSIDSIWF